jgi:hypothetical protein
MNQTPTQYHVQAFARYQAFLAMNRMIASDESAEGDFRAHQCEMAYWLSIEGYLLGADVDVRALWRRISEFVPWVPLSPYLEGVLEEIEAGGGS